MKLAKPRPTEETGGPAKASGENRICYRMAVTQLRQQRYQQQSRAAKRQTLERFASLWGLVEIGVISTGTCHMNNLICQLVCVFYHIVQSINVAGATFINFY